MKILHWIAVLTILASISLYAEVEVYRGYQTEGDKKCTGDFVIAGSVKELRKYDNQNDDWTLRSYIRVLPPGECKENTGSNPVFVTPGSLPGETEDVALVFFPAFMPRLAGDFDAEANQKLLAVWQEKTDNIPHIAGWVGETTLTTWSSTTPAEWNTEEFPPTVDMLGQLLADSDPLRINIYGDNISREAGAEEISFNDLVIAVQMEEHIHALQITTLKEKLENDLEQLPDDFELPGTLTFQEYLQLVGLADLFIMEVEAKTFIYKKGFPYVFGRQAPTKLSPKVTIPDDYYEKRLKFHELAKKLYIGTITEPEGEVFLKSLEYFESLLPVFSVNNPDYSKQAEREDEDSE